MARLGLLVLFALLCAALGTEEEALKPQHLTVDGIDATLTALDPNSFMLVELFACVPTRRRTSRVTRLGGTARMCRALTRRQLLPHRSPWCPVCQRFRPHFERVAARFNGPPSVPLLRVFQIDCVAQAALCKRYHVQGFPTLRFGHPTEFLGQGQGEEVTGAPREAEAVLSWINTRLQKCDPFPTAAAPVLRLTLPRRAGTGHWRCR